MEKVFHTKQMCEGALVLRVLLHYSQCTEEEEYTCIACISSNIFRFYEDNIQFIDKQLRTGTYLFAVCQWYSSTLLHGFGGDFREILIMILSFLLFEKNRIQLTIY